eukprot:GHVP01000407.1.p1 GENE.GHVP01000407.1~~GHVP01000407.1.p1  ORF type:complete len:1022 (-),score=188.44 GHVP01000407.1:2354-5419(-)
MALTVSIREQNKNKHTRNYIRSQRYSWYSFIPLTIMNQFKSFINIYFLIEGLLKFIPRLAAGHFFVSIVPLVMVILFSMLYEGYEDYMRYRRDIKMNSESYLVYRYSQAKEIFADRIKSASLKVGDFIWINKNERIPADIILLYTPEKNIFIRTDQLDGETDWKVRIPSLSIPKPIDSVFDSESGNIVSKVFNMINEFIVEDPNKDIHSFTGNLILNRKDSSINSSSSEYKTQPLTDENFLPMNTVLASSHMLGCIVYTGNDTKAQLNRTKNKFKFSILERETNKIVLFLISFLLFGALILTFLSKTKGEMFIIYLIRFFMILSSIVPINLRIGIEITLQAQGYFINTDTKIKNTITRTRNLTTELGRVQYLLSDKTGTLTKNEMILKRLCIGTLTYSKDMFDDELKKDIDQGYKDYKNNLISKDTKKKGKTFQERLYESVRGLSICHNVTPVSENEEIVYQAASPDEVAIVQFSSGLGVNLIKRTLTKMTIKHENNDSSNENENDENNDHEILHDFPFTSERKRMGIIIKDPESKEIIFYEKGADTIMSKLVKNNDWLLEESDNMARDGLRTLAFGCKKLTEKEYELFLSEYNNARTILVDRQLHIDKVIEEHLENNLELMAITGVEDKLQDDLCITLESLRNAGIKIWVLTGDKIETATCVAISSKLIMRGQRIITIRDLTQENASDFLNTLQSRQDCCLVIDGMSMEFIMNYDTVRFIGIASKLTCLVCCRCSPTQKANIAKAVRKVTEKVVCTVGDGGNDVSMIFESDVGIGIVGKEGMQASLAGDFSIEQFSHLKRLLLWHGRNSYIQMSKVVIGVVYRGMLLAVSQILYTASFYLAPIPLYEGLILVGYVTIYTSFPFISILLDADASEEIVLMYPELYYELTKGRFLNFKQFFITLATAIYQGTVIIGLYFGPLIKNMIDILHVSFTGLVVTALLTIGLSVHKWKSIHFLITMSISFLSYFVPILAFPWGFTVQLKGSLLFFGRLALVTCIAFIPYGLLIFARHLFFPETQRKL